MSGRDATTETHVVNTPWHTPGSKRQEGVLGANAEIPIPRTLPFGPLTVPGEEGIGQWPWGLHTKTPLWGEREVGDGPSQGVKREHEAQGPSVPEESEEGRTERSVNNKGQEHQQYNATYPRK